MRLPQIKKKVSAYILGEDGKITKQSLVAVGAALSATAVATLIAAPSVEAQWSHTNSLSHTYSATNDRVEGTHAHHHSHSSY